jgi:hypothetical protein
MSKEGEKVECLKDECAWWLAGGQPWNVLPDCVVHRLGLLVHRVAERVKTEIK